MMERFTPLIDDLNKLKESFEWMTEKITDGTINPLPQESAELERVIGETSYQAIALHQALMASRIAKVQLN